MDSEELPTSASMTLSGPTDGGYAQELTQVIARRTQAAEEEGSALSVTATMLSSEEWQATLQGGIGTGPGVVWQSPTGPWGGRAWCSTDKGGPDSRASVKKGWALHTGRQEGLAAPGKFEENHGVERDCMQQDSWQPPTQCPRKKGLCPRRAQER